MTNSRPIHLPRPAEPRDRYLRRSRSERVFIPPEPLDAVRAVEAALDLVRLFERARTSAEDRDLLERVAAGETIAEVARARGVRECTLRARHSRAMRKLAAAADSMSQIGIAPGL